MILKALRFLQIVLGLALSGWIAISATYLGSEWYGSDGALGCFLIGGVVGCVVARFTVPA